MIELDITNLAKVRGADSLTADDISRYREKLGPFLANIHARGQGFYQVIDDKETLRNILRFAKNQRGKWQDIVILAIGGSALGTICLEQSLTHLFAKLHKKRRVPRLHVLDNIDPTLMREIQDVLDLKKTLFIVVTKSGNTPETLAQYFYFRKLCDAKKLKAKKHFVFVTDPEKGLLRKIAKDEGIATFDVPPNVGGRFSVQTAVGLLPAALIGINITKLIRGFTEMRDCFISPDPNQNLPFQQATIQYLMGTRGKTIHVLMPYAQKLIRFADWYRQLLAESIGKALNDQGEMVNIGLTPINALGATDQHSQSQLYNEGPNDKFFMFVEVNRFGPTVAIPNPYPADPSVAFLKKLSFNTLINLEKRGTADAYTKNGRPNMTIRIDTIDEKTLGQLMMLFEGATAFLGEFYNINAFDQPGVELSKNLTKEYALALQSSR